MLRRGLLLLSFWFLIVGAAFSQSILPGFPPGLFIGRNAIDAPPPAGGPTWDSGNTDSRVALSGGDLIITRGAVNDGTPSCTRSTTAIGASAKLYVEIVLDVADSASLGIARSTFNVSAGDNLGADGNTPNISAGVLNSGYGFWNNQTSPDHGGAGYFPVATDGAVISMAYDVSNAKIWYRNNSVSTDWNFSGAADPATNTGGLTVDVSAGTYYVAACLSGNTTKSTVRFSSGSWGFSAPAGFSGL